MPCVEFPPSSEFTQSYRCHHHIIVHHDDEQSLTQGHGHMPQGWDSAKATGHHGRSPQLDDPSEPLPGCLSSRTGADLMGRITLKLHGPPVVPHITDVTHPNCCAVRRGGNLPARAAYRHATLVPSGTHAPLVPQWHSKNIASSPQNNT